MTAHPQIKLRALRRRILTGRFREGATHPSAGRALLPAPDSRGLRLGMVWAGLGELLFGVLVLALFYLPACEGSPSSHAVIRPAPAPRGAPRTGADAVSSPGPAIFTREVQR